MHELSVSSAIVDTVIRHARGRKVGVVHLRVGTLRQVVPESLDFYFGIVSRDTICADADLDLELIAALMRCRECDHEWDPAPEPTHEGDPAALLPRFRCPACDAAGAEVLAGDELLVDSIDVEEPAPEPAVAPAASSNGSGPHASPRAS
jgi:hydrogenase nickel incorporation protein HypA/HybF